MSEQAAADIDAQRARALARCSFLPGHPHKRFAKDVAAMVSAGAKLSERQAGYLTKLVWHYRRQIPAHLVPQGKPS